MPPSMQASLEPVVEQPVPWLASCAPHSAESMFTVARFSRAFPSSISSSWTIW